MTPSLLDVLGPEPTSHDGCEFSTYPGMEDYIFGHHKSPEGTNKDVWFFSSATLLAFLSSCKVAGLDCTFKMTPKMWYQTAIFLVFANGFWIPVCWFYCQIKKQSPMKSCGDFYSKHWKEIILIYPCPKCGKYFKRVSSYLRFCKGN